MSYSAECTLSDSHCKLSKAALLNKSSFLAGALGVSKFITIIVMYCVTLCSPDLDIQQPPSELGSSKSDSRSSTKCDQNHTKVNYEIVNI